MVVRATDKERFLRAELAEIRDFMRRKTPDIVRAPMFKNLVTNGGFDSDTVWSKGMGWTISGGQANKASGALSALSQSGLPLTYERKYLVSYDLTVSGGGVNPRLGVSTSSGNIVPQQTSGGSFAIPTRAYGDDKSLYFVASDSFVGSVDNVSIWEVDPSDNAPWLRLPYGQRVGKRGFIFRDGPRLMSNEYEEIFQGDQAFIKPLVAPGVNTEFEVYCGIGA